MKIYNLNQHLLQRLEERWIPAQKKCQYSQYMGLQSQNLLVATTQAAY